MIADVPVEKVRPGQTLLLRMSRRPVKVYEITRWDDGRIQLHWERPAARSEPGFNLDGRYLGSFVPLAPGETVLVEGLAAI